METLFGPSPYEVTPEMLAGLPAETPPLFRSWVEDEFRRGRLTTAVRAAIKSGRATNATEALLYMAEVAKTTATPLMVACDLKGQASPAAYRELKRVLGLDGEKRTTYRAISYRRLGIYSHSLVGLAETGQLPLARQAPSSQLRLFELDDELGGQLRLLLPDDESLPGNQVLTTAGTFRRSYLKQVSKCTAEGQYIAQSTGPWHQQYNDARGVIRRLRQLLRPVYGTYIDRLGSTDPFEGYLEFLTLLTWGSMVVYTADQPDRILFDEVPVTDRRLVGALGRLDALEVTSIGGKPPSLKERQTLRHLSQIRWRSMAELMMALVRYFGPDLTFEILDWKFGVGDHPKGSKVITPAAIKEKPLTSHYHQVGWYLALGKADGAVQSPALANAIRQGQLRVEQAHLVYWLAQNEEPTTHTRVNEPADDQEILEGHLLEPWHRGLRHAHLRATSNQVFRRLRHDLEGVETQRPATAIALPEVYEPPVAFPQQIKAALTYINS